MRFPVGQTGAPRSSSSLRAALFSTALFDELLIGLLVVGLPLVRDRLHLSYAQTGLLFTAGSLSSMLLEPVINLLADRGSKRRPVLAGVLALAAGFALAGSAPTYPWLLIAFVLIWPATGAAVGLSQAALIDERPETAARTMTRWAIFSGAGDLLAPIATGLLVALGMQWPALCLGAAVCWLLVAATIVKREFPPRVVPSAEEDGDGAGILPALRGALGDWTLLRLAGIEVCAVMLDEVFLGFVALYLRDALGASPAQVGLLLIPGAVAAIAGLIALERLLPLCPGMALLPLMALVALGGVITLLLAQAPWIAGIALVIVDLGAVGWYPIARAAAFERYPGRPGLVRTVMGVTEPAELLLPGAVGFIATWFDIRAALAVLGLAPLLVLVLIPRQGHQQTDQRPRS